MDLRDEVVGARSRKGDGWSIPWPSWSPPLSWVRLLLRRRWLFSMWGVGGFEARAIVRHGVASGTAIALYCGGTMTARHFEDEDVCPLRGLGGELG
jgi:hypothetical protein